MITEIIFDIETQKLFSEIGTSDPADLGVSVVSLYVREVDENQQEISGKILSFWEHELDRMWNLFKPAKRIIGFNSKKFDVPALRNLSPLDFVHLPHFDIMEHVREALNHSLSLATLAKYTLDAGKTDVGTNAVTYWRLHDSEHLNKLRLYCEADVLLTRDLYDFGVKNKFLKYLDHWNNVRSFPVDFSYPKEVIEASRQIGLF